MSFADLAISPAIHDALSASGIVTPSPIQAQVVPVLLEGRDVIAQARTGSGKTLAFALPMIERLADAIASSSSSGASASGSASASAGVQALVLVPTRELAIQVGDVVGPLAALRRLRTTLLYGGRSLLPESRALRSAQIVIGTPGRTLDHLRQGQLNLRGLRVLVLDEADEMLDRGFARDVERIIGFTPTTRQSALFSATVPEWVAGAARTYLRQPVTVKIDAGTSTPPDIEQTIYSVPSSDKLPALMSLLDRRDDGPVIVFGRTKHGVKKLAQKLAGFGYPAAALQGNLSQNARERVMTDFRSGRMPILLATNVAARGLDVAEVDLVINYELPETAEWFTHRVGRTGRMGRRGQAITFLTPEDGATWRQFERHLGRSFPRRVWGSDESDASGAAATADPTTLARSATPRDGLGSSRDGFAPSRERSASRAEGFGSSRQGSTSRGDDFGSPRDGFGSARDESGSPRDGVGSARDGSAARGDGFGARADARLARRDGSDSRRNGSAQGGDGSDSGRDGTAPAADGFEPARRGRDGRRDALAAPRQGRDGRRDAREPGREARDGRRDGFRSRRDGLDARRDGFEARGDAGASRRDGFDGRGGDVRDGDRRRDGSEAEREGGDVRRGTSDLRRVSRDGLGRQPATADGRRDAPRDGRRDASGARRDRDDARRDVSAGGDRRRDGFDGPRDGAGRRQGRSGAPRNSAAAGSVAMKVAARRPSRRGRKPIGRRSTRSAAA